MIALAIILVVALATSSLEQSTPLSPCPNVFMYETSGTEPGRWYGVVNLSTDSTLHSLWLNIVLDSKADILGNWIGDVTTTDNIDFKIENTKMKIHPGPAQAVRFFVQYNPLNKPPRLQAIRLNGREICNANNRLPAVDRPDERPSRPETTARPTTRPRPQETRPVDRTEDRPVRPVDRPSQDTRPRPRPDDDILVRPSVRPEDVLSTKPVYGRPSGDGSRSGSEYRTALKRKSEHGWFDLSDSEDCERSSPSASKPIKKGKVRSKPRSEPPKIAQHNPTHEFDEDNRSLSTSKTVPKEKVKQKACLDSTKNKRVVHSESEEDVRNDGDVPSQSVGTQTRPGSRPSRPENGYQATPNTPLRTTTQRRKEEDFDSSDSGDGDYFTGGQPTFIVPRPGSGSGGSGSNYFSHDGSTNKQPECGQVKRNNPNPLVVNGKPTLEGQWPWQIALYQTQTVDNKYICGGTLVSKQHVITAAHCVTRKGSSRIVNKNTLTVYLGKHNLRTSVEGVQIRLVGEIIVHPQYNASSFSRDLGILKLREPVTFTDWVRPACLWPENEVELSNVIGKKGSVVGWGFDDTGVATEELTLVEMPVVDQETCIRSYSEFFARFTSEYTYCAGYRDGTSVCNGDSGGGMVFNMHNIWYLRGLVSLSVARQNEYRCDPSHYVVFTDLAKFLQWIKQNISY